MRRKKLLKIVRGFRIDKINSTVKPGRRTRSNKKEKRKVKGSDQG
jgi:hypothetical protein